MTYANVQTTALKNKKVYLGFSLFYFFFDFIYLIVKRRFLLALLIIIIDYYLLPLPGLEFLTAFLSSNFGENVEVLNRAIYFFRNEYARYTGIAIFALGHILISFGIEPFLLRRDFKKKKYLPLTETDARILIAHHVCKDNISLASSPVIDRKYSSAPYYQNVDRLHNDLLIEKDHRIRLLKERFSSTDMTREEYEAQLRLILQDFSTNHKKA